MEIDRLRNYPVIILDSSILLSSIELKMDIEDEVDQILPGGEIVVPSTVLDEVECMRSSAARAAAKLARRFRIVHAREAEGVDNSLIDLAEQFIEGGREAIVATADKKLRISLKEREIKAILVRGRNRLELN